MAEDASVVDYVMIEGEDVELAKAVATRWAEAFAVSHSSHRESSSRSPVTHRREPSAKSDPTRIRLPQ